MILMATRMVIMIVMMEMMVDDDEAEDGYEDHDGDDGGFSDLHPRISILNPSGGWVDTGAGGGDRDEGTKDAIGHFLLGAS